jgi:hypothetical protein
MTEETLKNGESRARLVDLTVPLADPWKVHQGASVSVLVGAYVSGREINFTLAPGAEPEPVKSR